MSEKKIVYVYAGEGAGIPGLPHRVTRAEARELRAEKELDAALEAGVYVEEIPVRPGKQHWASEAKE